MNETTPIDWNTESGVLRQSNIEPLSRRVAVYVKRPRTISAEDARQDAAVILIGMRKDWDQSRVAHIPEDIRSTREEQIVINWARLRLIDLYEAEHRVMKRTIRISEMDVGITHGHVKENIFDPVDSREEGLTRVEASDIDTLVERLPDRMRSVVRALVYDGRVQKDVAVELGVTQPAVSATFNRACRQLSEWMEEYR